MFSWRLPMISPLWHFQLCLEVCWLDMCVMYDFKLTLRSCVWFCPFVYHFFIVIKKDKPIYLGLSKTLSKLSRLILKKVVLFKHISFCIFSKISYYNERYVENLKDWVNLGSSSILITCSNFKYLSREATLFLEGCQKLMFW